MTTQKAAGESPIIVAGMHRSGTSLVASLLRDAGVNVGSRLMAPAFDNVKGHQENLDFVEFHMKVLEACGFSSAGWIAQDSVRVPELLIQEAKEIIKANTRAGVWGWKDPRSSLFLDFWYRLLPEAYFVFVFRSPWEVMDSLFRRGDAAFQSNPEQAVACWEYYNQKIIDFYEKHSDRCFLIEVEDLFEGRERFISNLNEKFDLSLSPASNDIFDSSLIKTRWTDAEQYRLAIEQLRPNAIPLMEQLKTKKDLKSMSLDSPREQLQQNLTAPSPAFLLELWMLRQKSIRERQVSQQNLAHVSLQLEQVQAELEQKSSDLYSAHHQVQDLQNHISLLEEQTNQIQGLKAHIRLLEEKANQAQGLQDRISLLEENTISLNQTLEAKLLEAGKAEEHLQSLQDELERKEVHIGNISQSLQDHRQNYQKSLLELQGVQSSKFWRLRAKWFGLRSRLGLDNPHVSVKQALLQKIRLAPPLSSAPPLLPESSSLSPLLLPAVAEIPTATDPLYQQWLNQNYPTSAVLKRLSSSLPALKYQPLISIVVPAYNTPEIYLRQAIDSVLEQIYPNWELCIADDNSTDPVIRAVLKEYSSKDTRIKTVFRTENGHISLASNSALEIATGDFVALLDHDDLLTPDALYEVIVLLNQHPEADMIYSDEDKIDDAGKLRDPFFKPDWCPDSFLSRMYTCHFGVYRRSLIEQIGGFRAGYEGSQDYDLVLRFTEKTEQIFHIPKVLYHWRIHQESASSGIAAKPYAYDAGQRAIAEALKRRGEPGRVTENPLFRGHYTVRYDIQSQDLVSIIIPTRDLGHLLNQCLESIFTKSTYPNYEVILVDNGSTEAYTEKVISDWLDREPDRFYCYSYTIPFNYSKLNNYGVSNAKGKYLLFLNNDTEVIAPDWIEAMVEQAQRPSIGAVGARLLYSDGTLQHGGVILGIGGVAGHLHKGAEQTSYGYFDRLLDTLNYSAVTAACLMCRHDVFDKVNGFNEELAVAFNDVDFCLSIIKAGFRNICLPHAELYHHESKSRGYEDTQEKQRRFQTEINYMQDRWKTASMKDPCYNPNLSLDCEGCKITKNPQSIA